uniref:Uncharacterized protein n=1 Tax=Anguilla anguilla TaxID=7936 RepID=A0A0E9TJL6_ANGAN
MRDYLAAGEIPFTVIRDILLQISVYLSGFVSCL